MKTVEPTVMCFLIKKEKILLLKRKDTWFEDEKYCPPGGLVDPEESPAQACVREVLEETNLEVPLKSLTLIKESENSVNGRNFHNYYFKTEIFSGNLKNLEPERHSDAGWFHLDALPKDTSKLVHDLVDEL